MKFFSDTFCRVFLLSALFVLLFFGVSTAKGADKVVTLGYFASKNFQEGDSDSSIKSGFAYEYLQKISDYTGWQYKYIYGEWSTIYDMFLKGEIDVMAGLAYRDDRKNLMEYPDYFIDIAHHYIFISQNDTVMSEDNVTTINGKRVGCLRNSNMTTGLKKWASEHHIKLELVYYDDMEDLPKALSRGEVEGFTGADKSIDMSMNVKPLVLYAAPKSYICVRKGATRLLQELNDALSDIKANDATSIENLKRKYYRNISSNTKLSDAEVDWLSTHKTLRISYAPDHLPYCAKDENGQVKGILKDIVDLWLEKMNLKDKLQVQYVTSTDYTRAISELHNGDVDIFFPMPHSRWYAEQNGVMLTSGLVEVPMSIIFKGEYNDSTRSRVALTTRPKQSLFMQEMFPNSTWVPLDDVEECAKAVIDGRATSAVMTTFKANSLIREAEYSQLKILPIGDNALYAMGIRKGNIALQGLLNRGFAMMDYSAINNALYSYTEYRSRYSLSDFIRDNFVVVVLMSVLVVLIIIAFFILYVSGIKSAQRETQNQVEVAEALSLDYPYAVMVDIEKGCSITIKMEGKVLKEKDRIYHESYDASWKYFVNRHVIENDRDEVLRASSLDVVLENLKKQPEYVCTYRAEWDGKEHYTQTTFTKVHSSTFNKDVVIVGCKTVDDIVAKERERQELMANALAVAEHSSQSKTIFLNNMSHDIRTPMNAIIGFTNLAKNHIDDSEAVRGYLNKISISSSHLLSLINNVLDMSRIESGKVKLAEERVHLPSMIREIQDMVQNSAQSKGVGISFYDALANEVVLADDLKLKQVLLNVVGNAIKFTLPGGKVSVSVVERGDAPEGYASYQFTVADTGIGMSTDFRSHLFEAFSREKTSTVSGIQGTGLGMAITKNIVDMMGGNIVVESTPNVGTKITILLSFKFGKESSKVVMANILEEEPVENPIQNTSSNFGGTKVLLVEDNLLNQEIAVSILQELGCVVDVAADGCLAVEKIRNSVAGTYDIVLMDIQMPNMDGYAATRIIRGMADSAKALIPIVALTANAFEEDRQKAFDAGMNGHVSKPISVLELMEIMKKLV